MIRVGSRVRESACADIFFSGVLVERRANEIPFSMPECAGSERHILVSHAPWRVIERRHFVDNFQALALDIAHPLGPKDRLRSSRVALLDPERETATVVNPKSPSPITKASEPSSEADVARPDHGK